MLGCLLAVLLAFWLGSLGSSENPAAAKGPTVDDLARLRSASDTRAKEQYAAGLADGHAEFAPGTPAYRRVYGKGARTARKAMAARVKAQYAKGVRDGKAAAQKSYRSGREAGYDAGYDEGWDDGYDEGFDDSIGVPPDTSGGGAEDLPDIGYDLDCSDFPGPVSVSPGDPHDLDRDGDGIGCE